MPEEIPIIASAYLAYEGAVPVEWAIFFTVLAALMGDTIIFLVGRHFGHRIFELPILRNMVTRRRLRRANVYFKRWGNGVVFMGRFLAGVRSTVFLSAAILKMPLRRFLLLDGAAAVLSIPLNIIIVYSLLKIWGEDLHAVIQASRKFGHDALLVAAIVVLGLGVLIYFRRKNKHRANGKKTSPTPSTTA